MTIQKSMSKKARKVKLDKVEGYLFAKLHAIGSKSEGPLYFIQQKTGDEILVMKKVERWKNDPVLHPWVGRKVVVFGRSAKVDNMKPFEQGIDYTRIMNTDEPLLMNFKLKIKGNILWIDKMPGPTSLFPPMMKNLAMSMSVACPARTNEKEWEGKCPTSKLYDFWIEDPRGKVIWNWSDAMYFNEKTTKVYVTCKKSSNIAKVLWNYFDDSITRQGLYVAHAKFIATGQEVRRPFWVKFAE